MRGKTVVITGGTSGIGEVAALTLARMGARIVLIARDKTRADTILARLRDNAPGIAHAIYLADLSRLAEMKRVAAQVAEHEPRIDVLINNAGGLFATRRLTEDGLEGTFALNHMAYFVVTEGLRERLLELASSTYHQHRLCRAPRRHAGFQRSSIGEELRSRESLSSVEALQHPVYS
jgi:NAD(P)-dependent dehydrogenase (short-subunit alcohol dehydrogenase family)